MIVSSLSLSCHVRYSLYRAMWLVLYCSLFYSIFSWSSMIFPLLLVVVPGGMHSFDMGSRFGPWGDRLSTDYCGSGYQPSRRGYQYILFDIICLSCHVRYSLYRVMRLVLYCSLFYSILSWSSMIFPLLLIVVPEWMDSPDMGSS